MTKKYFLLLLLFAIPSCRSRRGPAPMPYAPNTSSVEAYCTTSEGEPVPCPMVQGQGEVEYQGSEEVVVAPEEAPEESTEEVTEPSDAEEFEFEEEPVEEELMEEPKAEETEESAIEEVLAEISELAGTEENEQKTEKMAQGVINQKELKPIYYAFNSKTLNPEQNDVLSEDLNAAKELSSQGYEIIVRGHSCHSGGSDDYNDKLAKQRAESIANYLKKNGVNARTESYGSKRPLVAFGNKSEQAMNRRVEIVALANN